MLQTKHLVIVGAALTCALIVSTVRSDTIYLDYSPPSPPGYAIGTIGATGGIFQLAAGLSGSSIAVDDTGNVYVPTGPYGGTVARIAPGGEVSTYATTPGLLNLAFDPGGNLYASGDAVYKITPDGQVSTFVTGFAYALACDAAGNLYAATDGYINKITPSGVATAFAIEDPPEGWGVGLAVDSGGNVYYSDSVSSIVKISPGGSASIFADGLNEPGAMAFDSSRNLFVIENPQAGPGPVGTILEIAPDGKISTFATGLPYLNSIAIQTPEPSSLALLSLGTFALLARRRRR